MRSKKRASNFKTFCARTIPDFYMYDLDKFEKLNHVLTSYKK